MCIHCNYVSARKYNLQRHISSAHKNINDDSFLDNETLQNVNITRPEVNIACPEVNIACLKVNTTLPNVNTTHPNVAEIKFQCIDCQKVFANNTSLKRHSKICKRVSNILECHFCHKIYASKSSKSQHIKTCDKAKIAKNIKINNGTINNTTNNNTNSHNVTTNNNITNNVTINFPRGIDVPIKFNTDHITDDKFRKLVVENKNNMESIFENFSRLLYEDKSNICVKKTNLKSEYAQVHLNERWINKIDNLVFPKLTKNLVEEISKMMDSKEEFLLKKLKTHIFDAISKFFDEMGIDPYDLEGEEKQVIQQLKTLIKIAMGIVFDITD